MRRLLTLTLAVLMMLVAIPVWAEGGSLHLLWEMPFGGDTEAVIQAAYENTGIKLRESGVGGILETGEDQNISMAGYPVTCTIYLTGGTYDCGYVKFLGFEPSSEASKAETADHAIQMMRGICENISANSGPMNGAYFQAGSSLEGDQIPDMIEYDFPVLGDAPDFETISLAAQYEDSISVYVVFGNILVELRTWQSQEPDSFQSSLTVTYYNEIPPAEISRGLGAYIPRDPINIDLNF